MLRKNNKGFTLIELVMVIVILGILAVIAVPRYQELRDEAHISADAATIGAIRAGIMTHFAKNRVYPASSLTNDTFFTTTLTEKPSGWSYAQIGTGDTGTISCNGLPTNTSNIATWTYNSTAGTITPATSHPTP